MTEDKIEQNWKLYVGKEVCITTSDYEIYGVMQTPNLQLGFVDFLPHRCYSIKDEQYYLEKDTPRRIGIRILQEDPKIHFLPFRDGHLEALVKNLNESLKKKDNPIGFKHSI